MKNIYLLLLLFPSLLTAQSELDSLWNTWQDESQPDTSRVLALNYFTWKGVMYTNPDSAFKLCELQFDFAQKHKLDKYQANALMGMGSAKFIGGHLNESLAYFEKSLSAFEKQGNTKAIAVLSNNMAGIYQQQGNYVQALHYFQKSMRIKEAAGDSNRVIITVGNMALIFQEQGDFEKALMSYNQVLDYHIRHKNNDEIRNALNNIGTLFYEKKDYNLALEYFERIERYTPEVEDKFLEASRLENIGRSYLALGQYEVALAFAEKARSLSESIGDLDGLNTAINSIGNIYLAKNQVSEAIDACQKNYRMSEELGTLIPKMEACKCLYKAYRAKANYNSALAYYEQMNQLKDSIYNEENTRQLTRLEVQYEYDKKVAADSVKAAEAQKVANAQIAAQEAQLEQEKTQRYALFGGIGLLTLFGGVMFNRFRFIKKQHDIIEEQKQIVEIQKAAVEATHEQLTEKNQEILDSIQYAKRIQTAILPPDKIVKEYLPSSFILYKPKDVVAGDFYWLESVGDLVLFAAADCTGHGVPGAMVSVICNNGLNRSVREFGLTKPSEILDKTRELVIQEFEKSEEEVKDGMDISLCTLNIKTNELQWSGANNPLWIVRKGSEEIDEIKADKQPIGKYGIEKPFTNHQIQLNEGDSIYLFSDGFPDQFGGERGKKYKSGKFKNTIIEFAAKNMSLQRELFDQEFEEWKGSIEQIDDVCVIGVEIMKIE